ncbi:hypothetical protein NW762_004033 [Fusarium torreyae]|uniref:Uncharacterized protein n=1 Tax=Fusarium torreyae TaxID=1237075 RepID=A0A9W8VJW3_9HYPO|nr:hypothetical protein NW762_004033 [Fusarium torreyae]
MGSSSLSHHASANQANHSSTQVNGNVGPQLSINNAFFDILDRTPIENIPQVPPSITKDFNFGPIPALEADQDEDDESKHMPKLPPTITKDDVEYFSRIGINIRQKYKLILERTTGVKATCVKQLRQKAKDQRARIILHVDVITQWPKFPAKPRRSDVSTHATQGIPPNSSMGQETNDLKAKLGEIHNKLKDAINSIPQIPKQSQGRSGERGIRSSKVFKNLTKLFEQTELDIAAVESQVYQRSGCRWPFETTKGFIQLYVSSSATRTLYRHLCQACPLQEQGHGHTALVGLVPVLEKEPLCIVPNQVAKTRHHVAIESTFCKGDYIWFEAHSRLLLPGSGTEAVDSEPSSSHSAVIDGLRQRSRRDSGYSSASASSKREVQISQKRSESGDFCRVQVCPGSLAQGSDRLAMCIGDDQESGHQIFYLGEKKRPETSYEPLNLAEIIQEGEERVSRLNLTLFKRSLALRNNRFKIALKIAEATLRYGWREWLGDAWGISDIEFYPVESERMPFLRAEIFNHGCGRLEKFMSNLGFVLLQLGLWEQLHIRPTGLINDKELEKQLNRLGSEVGAPYQEAVRYCMLFAGFDDCKLNDNDIFQETFYRKVVSPLRQMVMRTENAENKMLGKSGMPE